MMSSRDRVLTVFCHEEPDRVPAWCGASVEFWAKAKRELGLDDEQLRVRFGDDFRRVFARYAGPEVILLPNATSCTPFGSTADRFGLGYNRCHIRWRAQPLARFTTIPGPILPGWMSPGSAKKWKSIKVGMRSSGGDWSPYWHDLIDLLGMENMYLKMYDEPEFIDAILTHVVDYYAAVSERIFEVAADVIDIFFIGNDFGSQRAGRCSPRSCSAAFSCRTWPG